MVKLANLLLAIVLMLGGAYLVVFGSAWAPLVFKFLPESEIGYWTEHFIAFVPLLFIALGAALFVHQRR